MKVNEIVINDDDLLIDILIDKMAALVKKTYDSLSRNSDNFLVNAIDTFTPEERLNVLDFCVEILSEAKVIYTHNQQTIRILNYLIMYLSGK